MLLLQISQICKRNRLLPVSLNQINSPQELKNTGKETLMVAQVQEHQFQVEQVWLIQTCKFCHKKEWTVNNT